jgi:hypothetical protein
MLQIFTGLNIFAIILAYLVSLLSHRIWYSKYIFKKTRDKLLKKENTDFSKKTSLIEDTFEGLISVIFFFFTLLLGFLISYSKIENLLDGLFLGFFLFILVFLVQFYSILKSYTKEFKSQFQVLFLDAGLYLIIFILQSLIFSFWK